MVIEYRTVILYLPRSIHAMNNTCCISLYFSIEQNHFRNHDGPRSPKEAAGGRSQASLGPTGTQHVGLGSQDGDKNVMKQPSAGFAEGSSSQCYSAEPTNFLPERTQRGKSDEDGYVALRKDNSSSGRIFLCCRKNDTFII